MQRKIIFKMTIDALMSALFLIVLAPRSTGILGHEVVGVLLGLLFVVHNVLNKEWYKNLFHGPYNLHRGVWVGVNLILLAVMLALMVSGVLISRELFDFLPIAGGWTARRVHTAAAYWGFVVTGVHLGLHGGLLKGVWCNQVGKWGHYAVKVMFWAAAVYGVKAFVHWHIGAKLMMRRAFQNWEGITWVYFLVSHIAIWCLCACVAYYTMLLLQRLTQKTKNKED